MADIFVENWDALVSNVNKVIPNILVNDIAPVAESVLVKHIKKDIYDAYKPKENGWVVNTGNGWVKATYKRRYDLDKNVYSRIYNQNTLLVSSRATANTPVRGSFRNNEGAFLKLLESGNMGLWRGGFPRPAVTNTQNDFESNVEIEAAIKKGIKREIGVCTKI